MAGRKAGLSLIRRGRSSTLTGFFAVAAALLLAVFLAPDFGQSWDDPGDAAYGSLVLKAYGGSSAFMSAGDRKYYGPAYLVVASAVSDGIHAIYPSALAVDVRHLLNFGTFVVGLLAFYGIARRLTDAAPAVLGTLMFGLQPLLFGHAFINQKDIPFLAAFTLSVFLGLRVYEREGGVPIQGPTLDPTNPGQEFRAGWHRSSRTARFGFVLATAGAAILWADVFWGHRIQMLAEASLASAYQGKGWGALRSVFLWIAQDAFKTPFSAYAAKLGRVFQWVGPLGAVFGSIPAVAIGEKIRRFGGGSRVEAATARGRLVAAGVLLGLTMSTRVAGVFAGALVSIYILLKEGRRSLVELAVYWGVAGILCYLTWPYLWAAPIHRFLQAIEVTANFPSHLVFFKGDLISSTQLPWDYLPTLLAIQITESALLVMALGSVAFYLLWRHSPEKRILLVIILLWVLVPMLASVIGRVPLYSNFRQVLFLLPPLFLIAAAGIGLVWGMLPGRWRVPLAFLLLVPGLVAMVQLHPYEYVYYNSLAGGVQGTNGLFPHDYWCTSYRAAMEYVDTHAAPGARIAIAEPFEVAATFARPDLTLVRAAKDPMATYRLVCNNRENLAGLDPSDPGLEMTVSQSGVIMTGVWRGEGPQ
jgi:hypothetical protein